MFFRPNYCAQCGEKVERTDWGLFTSRRFCQVCESEFKGQDLIPRAVVAASLLFGVFGLGAYLKGPAAVAQPVAFRQPQRVLAATPEIEARKPESQPQRSPQQSPETRIATAPAQSPIPRIEAEEAYICGAETKKGTPCSRRVKGNIRCYQHKGMPAMLPPDKLKLS